MNKYGAEFFGTSWLVPGRIPVTIASVHPARSTGFGVFVGEGCCAVMVFLDGPNRWRSPWRCHLSVHRQHRGLINIMPNRLQRALRL